MLGQTKKYGNIANGGKNLSNEKKRKKEKKKMAIAFFHFSECSFQKVGTLSREKKLTQTSHTKEIDRKDIEKVRERKKEGKRNRQRYKNERRRKSWHKNSDNEIRKTKTLIERETKK